MKKQENKNKIYLFKSGSFYIFLGDDAELMAKELGLKLLSFLLYQINVVFQLIN